MWLKIRKLGTVLSAILCAGTIALWFNSADLSWFKLDVQVRDAVRLEVAAAHSVFIAGLYSEDDKVSPPPRPAFEYQWIRDDADLEAYGARVDAAARGLYAFGLGAWFHNDLIPVIFYGTIPFWFAVACFAIAPTRWLLRLPNRARWILPPLVVLGLLIIALILLQTGTFPPAFRNRLFLPVIAGLVWWWATLYALRRRTSAWI